MAYAMPLKTLVLTGKQPPTAKQLTADEAGRIVSDGRGWTNGNRHAVYDQLPADTLLECLTSWSPIVRERTAIALGRKKEMLVGPVVFLLDAPELETRLGACQALVQMKIRAAPAVPKLRDALDAKEMWLRIKAADALVAIGDEARPTIPKLLDMLIREPGADDPRSMEQRFLSFALFDRFLSKSLDEVDREKLLTAVRAVLLNEDGRSRSSVLKIYPQLTEAEIKILMPDINRSVVEPSPSGIMFSDGSRMTGLELMAANHVETGIDACLYWLKTQNHWASEKRTPKLLGLLQTYGVHAQRTIPDLEKLADEYAAGIPSYFPKHLSLKKAEFVREAIKQMKETKEKPELISM